MRDDGASLRIALCTHSVNPRGGVVHTLELAKALHEAGHRVTVFAPAAPGQSFFRAVPHRVSLVPVAGTPKVLLELVPSRIADYVSHLASVLERESFDLLHAQDSISGNALATLAEQGLIAGFVRTVHHLDHFDDPRLMAWQRRAFEQADRVVCVSRLWKDLLWDEHRIDAAIAHNGVDLERYSTRADRSDAAVVARLGLRPDAPLVLAVGGIEARKNTPRLLHAFTRLRASRPLAQLVVAGGVSLLDHDDCVREFDAIASTHALSIGPRADIVLTGKVPDDEMPALFRAADVLAMPSLREGFGLVVLEALASGTPVVVSRTAPFIEYLSEADAEWADPFDAASITRALQRALAPARSEALAKATPAVCVRFNWPASARRHVEIYRDVTSASTARLPETTA